MDQDHNLSRIKYVGILPFNIVLSKSMIDVVVETDRPSFINGISAGDIVQAWPSLPKGGPINSPVRGYGACAILGDNGNSNRFIGPLKLGKSSVGSASGFTHLFFAPEYLDIDLTGGVIGDRPAVRQFNRITSISYRELNL
jgi:hypothetical protein